MFRFGQRSEAKLRTCHGDLQMVARRAIHHMDFAVLWGARDQVSQDEAYRNGESRLRYPHSRHNTNPSYAIDVAPWPLDFGVHEDPRRRLLAHRRYVLLAGVFLTTASVLGVRLRWGGDWNGRLWRSKNKDLAAAYDNQSFDDLGHFELMEP